MLNVAGSMNNSSLTTADGDSPINVANTASEIEPVYACLLPWFSQVVGVFTVYLISRYVHGVPYTAVLFVFGVLLSVGALRTHDTDELSDSVLMWLNIDQEVLFNVFLPGLLFKDAFEINFYLFQVGFWQIIVLAFPMVLAGTLLTACVAMYIFPYGWSWYMSLTFGAILSATDPVAVCALLNEVAAPPRLRMHISGEALMNDGSAVVFFTVFSALFLYELDIGLGKDASVGEAFVTFFRMSLGGAAVGIGFAFALVVVLHKLNRRYDGEETVLQVVIIITAAYLSFYTSEIVCKMSGVLAVVFCGVFTNAFGASLISDWKVLTSFLSILEHLLNTVLFTLGGLEFGKIIASTDHREWNGQDWGYMILLYVLLIVIRAVCMAAFYPIIVNIGLKSNWQEAVFSTWAGLRGAIAIALSIGLDNLVVSHTDDPEKRNLTTKLFGMVGGVAFLTLIINGPLSGPLLAKLQLADSTETRRRIVDNVQAAVKRRMLDDFLSLMTDDRFYFVDFALVIHHCPLLRDLTAQELLSAFQQNKESVHPSHYKYPVLDMVLPYIADSEIVKRQIESMMVKDHLEANGRSHVSRQLGYLLSDDVNATESTLRSPRLGTAPSPALLRDMRLMFVELLRSAYQAQIRQGKLDPREYNGFLRYMLLQSLEFAHAVASSGKQLNDWTDAQVVSSEFVDSTSDWGRKIYECLYRSITSPRNPGSLADLTETETVSQRHMRLEVLMAFSFLDAHKEAEERLKDEFGENSEPEIVRAYEEVIEESRGQTKKAKAVLRSKNLQQLKHVISHYLCSILHNKAARYVHALLDAGVVLQSEARHFLEEIEGHLTEIRDCKLDQHPGAMKIEVEVVAPPEETSVKRRKREKQLSLF